MRLRLLGVVCACLANTGHAASLSTAEFYWDTFTIMANGADFSDSIVWYDQADIIDTRYIEGATTGSPVETVYDLDPNIEWATSQQTNDGELATDANTSVTPHLVSASTEVNFTGRAESRVSRYGRFTVPADATYSFSIDYSLSAEVNTTNSETGGGRNSLVANPYVELDIRRCINIICNTDFFGFVLDGSVDITDTFGTISGIGTLTVDQTNNDGTPFAFTAGDVIQIGATATSLSASYSSMAPVPVPPAIILFISGIGALLCFGHRARSAVA